MEPQIIPNVPIPVLNTQTPNTTTTSTPSSQSTSESQNGLNPQEIQNKPIPQLPIAIDTIGTSLDTQQRKILGTFSFGQVGAIQIGTYSFGVSGQINISPNGVIATNLNNQTTFTLDGTTGNATFLGTIRSGSLISGSLTLGGLSNGNGTMTIADGSGNAIITGDNLGHHYYDTLGNELARVNSTGLNVYGTAGSILRFFDSNSTTTPWAKMGYNTGSGFNHSTSLYAVGTIELRIYPDNTYVSDNAHILIGTGSPLFEDIILFSKNNIQVITGGVFQVNGATKTAIVPTTEGYNALYCVEAPEVWFFDFAKDVESIDPLFLEVTEGEMKIIVCSDKSIQVWRRRKGYKNTRFERKTVEQFTKNNAFWQQPQID